MFILNEFKNYVFNNCFQVKDATSPYNLQNYKKIFIYALNKQELRFFVSKTLKTIKQCAIISLLPFLENTPTYRRVVHDDKWVRCVVKNELG